MVECKNCGATNTDDREVCFKCTVVLDKPVRKALPSKTGSSTTFLVVLIIVLGIAYFVIAPNFNRRRSYHPPYKRCIANMKMLENALEMYDMDTPPNKQGMTTVVCQTLEPMIIKQFPLKKGGYVQRWPKCPLTNRKKPMKAEYFVSREGIEKSYALYVFCTLHGTISNPITKHDKKPFSFW